MGSGESFQISSLRDIYNLPSFEQMVACLEEMTVSILQARAMNDLVKAQAEAEGHLIDKVWEWPEFCTWEDDGKGQARNTYNMPSGDQVVVSFTGKEGA